MRLIAATAFILLLTSALIAQPAWQADLDSKLRFYQTTDFGILVAGTERSLYAVDGQTGERIWRRSTGRINETAITPIPDTDLILISRDLGSKSRLEAVDLVSGAAIWQSDKVKGDVMQLAIDPNSDLLAVVLVKDPRADAGREFKRTPIVHMLRLSSGEELWKRSLDSDVDMMPARFGEDLGEIAYTLDNYRAPMILDGRLFLFYEGATSYDAATGQEKERNKFKVNESGLALTEADPVFDDRNVYISGRGQIRAVDRRTGSVLWKANDLGISAEMAVLGRTLFVRTGGQFTRLKDGEIVSKGPYGVSAIDTETGKTKWRYKGADKGLTNFVFSDVSTILIADSDDIYNIDAATGKLRTKWSHDVDRAQFIIVNARGEAVVGGRDEIAAFGVDPRTARSEAAHSVYRSASFRMAGNADDAVALWRIRHKAPSRGVLRIVAGIALRATALYFRYGGLATSAIGLARGGLNLASTVNSFRWSGLRSRFGSFDLTTLASNTARNYATRSIYSFGSFARTPAAIRGLAGFQVITPAGIRSRLAGGVASRLVPSRADVQESVLDRLDPARYADRLSDYLLRRKRVAELRGSHMYFYTDLPKPFDRKGLVGVDLNTGRNARFILASDPDPQFVTDEAAGLLYSADGDKLRAFNILSR
jgi:outer membrane protein assembly factor BamB